jgi:hypothetical protein
MDASPGKHPETNGPKIRLANFMYLLSGIGMGISFCFAFSIQLTQSLFNTVLFASVLLFSFATLFTIKITKSAT